MQNQPQPLNDVPARFPEQSAPCDEALSPLPFLVFDLQSGGGWDNLDMPTILVAQQVLVALAERKEILAELELDPSDVAVALMRIDEMRSRSEAALTRMN
jgi:hypothetical protein